MSVSNPLLPYEVIGCYWLVVNNKFSTQTFRSYRASGADLTDQEFRVHVVIVYTMYTAFVTLLAKSGEMILPFTLLTRLAECWSCFLLPCMRTSTVFTLVDLPRSMTFLLMRRQGRSSKIVVVESESVLHYEEF